MSGGRELRTLTFTVRFFDTSSGKAFSDADRRRFRRALERLDRDVRHPSLRVHALQGSLTGLWSASASDELRLTFQRLEGGRKRLIECSRHYH
jgi:mRNA-degrading endonuclease YafQ of YafQ-DinJ toxin-antitoxin module